MFTCSSHLTVGFIIGLIIPTVFRFALVRYSVKYCPLSSSSHSINRSFLSLLCRDPCQTPPPLITRTDSDGGSKYHTDRNLVLVAVMTAKKLLRTRAVAAHNTWAKSIPGKVIFFSSEGSEKESPPGIKVIGLRGVDDSYPPQKKSFMMLKYIHDHYIDKFRFFVRADDDIYIKGEAFQKFLHSVKSTGIPVIGRPGLGNKQEFGKIYLGPDDNYCMGGPGVIMTREILAKTVRHIRNCLKNLYTTHEDVELGRCITKSANVTCTWSQQKIFSHNFYEPKGSFTHSLRRKDIHKSITLHPVKIPAYTYRLHQYVLSLKITSLRNRLRSLQQQIDAMNILLSGDNSSNYDNRMIPVTRTIHTPTGDAGEWNFVYKRMYSAQHENPKPGLQIDQRIGQEEVYDKILNQMNIKQRNIPYYFLRKHPLYGQQYIVGIGTKHQISRNSKSTKNTVMQVYARRPFLEVEFRECVRIIYDESADPKMCQPNSYKVDSAERVNFILPLAGRYSIFLKFIQNFEEVFLKANENVSLTIMLFRNDPNDTSSDVMTYVTLLKQTYNASSLSVVLMNGRFSRGVALQNGSRRFQDDALLFFVDVDLEIQLSTLLRIRLNTVNGQTVYAPIFFSHYDPKYLLHITSSSRNLNDTVIRFNSEFGYWRQHSFGMISTYKSDFDRAGGYRQNIKGWGLEDVDLVKKFISAKLVVIRSVDVGLSHRFHPIVCDQTLAKIQYEMCVRTNESTSSSTAQMADLVYRTPEIFNRNHHHHPIKPTTRSLT